MIGPSVEFAGSSQGFARIQIFLVHTEIRIGNVKVVATALRFDDRHFSSDIIDFVLNRMNSKTADSVVVVAAFDTERALERTAALRLDQGPKPAVEKLIELTGRVGRRNLIKVPYSFGSERRRNQPA